MTSRRTFVRHVFDGGWATDFGQHTDTLPDASNILRVPFLINAEDIIYGLAGEPIKIPGGSKLNSTVLEGGASIKGLFDLWFSGTGGSSTQHRIVFVDDTIKKDDADGTFTNLFTGLTAGAVPAFSLLDDIVILSNDNSGDVPKSWDGTTAQNLAGTPPNFSFSETHKDRSWAAGIPSTPSRLHYSVLIDPEDWVGLGSGTIDIDPDDGDRITGIISHKNELWVFKGPYKGSIHRITGSAPTGDDPFAKKTFIKGIGGVGHNSLFRFRDDIGFMWSDGTIHSLNATERFGDFTEASLSRPINVNFISKRVNFQRLKHAWSVNSSAAGYVLFAIAIDGSTDNNMIMMMDYRFDPPRWALWPSLSGLVESIASVVDPTDSNRRIVMTGGADGFVRKFQQPDRSIDGMTALNFKVTLPYLTYGAPIQEKTFREASLGLEPETTGTLTFGFRRDQNPQQTRSVAQTGGAVLAPAATNQFTLGISTLGGAEYVEQFFDVEDGSPFRSIQYEITNSGNFETVTLRSISTGIEGGAWSTTN